ncbi:hypothetical protein Moror_4955 [Moniliophthora roreri MCA 2997]|uniref:DUF6534 domain-containing protein n=2 Tax=Moniliophthora roreri TaxID=221103 RepID=V2Y445_MONRO|nr:hypothetical protein Moror_4955 [Moniliophthora roreri MCA 2997]
MSSLPPIPPDIVRLTGPIFLGNLLNWALFGALSVQVYLYYLAFPKDLPLPKIIVSVVFALEFLQTVLSTRDAFLYFGYGWGNMNILNEVGLFWFSIPIVTGIVSCIVQLFFAWRIWIISCQRYVPIIIGLLSVCQVAAGVWTGVQSKIIQFWSDVQVKNGTPPSVWLVSSTTCDVFITITMFYCLSTSRTGFRSTNAILVKFIRLTVETGLITSTLTVVDLALFLSIKDTNYYLALSIMLSKLYSNSLLVLLNARICILNGREIGQTSVDSTLSWLSTSSRPIVHQPPQFETVGPSRPPSILRFPRISMVSHKHHANTPLSVAVTRITESTSDAALAGGRSFDSARDNLHTELGERKMQPVCNV